MFGKKICKKTYGVSICRYNKNQVEILMIKKRYTYSFFSFVFGYYKKYNKKQIKSMFNTMTIEEKIDIMSLNFSILWYRIWLTNPDQNYNFYNNYKNTDNNNNGIKNIEINKNTEIFIDNNLYYYKKKHIFERTFLKDGGKKIKKLIQLSMNYELEWEIPKGGSSENETDVLCACRELEEETNITVGDYILLHDIEPVTITNIDFKVTYMTRYYIGYMKNNSKYKPLINFNNKNQVSEISDIKWFNVNDIVRKTNSNNIYIKKKYNELENIFRIISEKFKKKIKMEYYKPQ